MNDGSNGTGGPGPAQARSSAVLHRIGDAGANAVSGIIAGAIAAAWLLFGVCVRFPDWWQVVLYSGSATVTFVMVFVIQHTQHRQVLALQRKLDELIRATGRADNSLISVEYASEAELQQLADSYRGQRHDALGE